MLSIVTVFKIVPIFTPLMSTQSGSTLYVEFIMSDVRKTATDSTVPGHGKVRQASHRYRDCPGVPKQAVMR